MTRRRKMSYEMIDLLGEIIDRKGVSKESLDRDGVNRANGLISRGYAVIYTYANGDHYLATDAGHDYIQRWEARNAAVA